MNLDMNKLNIIVGEYSEYRKTIHQYLDRITSCKTSAYCNLFKSNTNVVGVISPCCEKKHNLGRNITNYYEEDDGRFSHYTINCRNYGEQFYYEPHFENCREVKIRTNNIILVGNYLRGYNAPKHVHYKRIDDSEIKLQNIKIYSIENPSKILSKRDLVKYVTTQLSSDNCNDHINSLKSTSN